jgi:methanogenic corrinoid protein MtbC1
VIADLKADAAQAAAEKLVAIAGGRAIGIGCDVLCKERVEAAVARDDARLIASTTLAVDDRRLATP